MPMYPIQGHRHIKNRMLTKKGIMMVFRHILGIAPLDYHSLKYVQNLGWLPCPQDEGKREKELYQHKYLAPVPYRDLSYRRFKHKENETRVNNSRWLPDEARFLRDRGGKKIPIRWAIDMMKRVYNKLKLKYDPYQEQIQASKTIRSPKNGIVGFNANVPLIQIYFGPQQLRLKNKIDGWATFQTDGLITCINLEGVSFPKNVEFLGESRFITIKVWYWSYFKKTYRWDAPGSVNEYNYWENTFTKWEDSDIKWEELKQSVKPKLYRHKGNSLPSNKIRKIKRKKNGDDKTKDKQSKILY